jgi:prepilin-type N-terminal cleavage/methylation domain-containing protein
MMKRKGFTLVEIMIVVAIIALLAAIAIPNLLRARLQANESAAQAALKTIATAEITYRSANATYATLTQLGTPGTGPAYIDAVLMNGTKSGYVFAITGPTGSEFHASATPTAGGGIRSFCIMEDGVVRVNPNGAAIANHTACEGLAATEP